ncbi:MAG: hypothetical protein PHT39_06285 [Sphaerochaetaceae bacterium]|nr:hypothetical protein [Sphaerochaetaceae bacterium]MDD3162846.1 hypothetical protein [Sphaerochaetaceae bacterium]MDD4397166.1 hypothetical protein [Sphaerochaetaceae bacterium]
MQDLQLIYIILPLALAVVILTLVLILISQLRKEVRLSKLKSVTDQYMVKLDSASKIMENRIAQYNDQLELKIKAGEDILSRTASQIEDLSGYSEDLANLKEAMTTYHQALNELSDLTARSEDEIARLDERALLVSKVQAALEAFEVKFADISKTVSNNEARLSAMLADFQHRNDDTLAAFDSSNDEKATAFESRIGGMIGAFEARVSSDIKLFDAQMSSKIGECQNEIASDVQRHEDRIKSIKQDNIQQFGDESNAKLQAGIEKLNSAFAAVAATVKELSSELDERSSALRDLVAGFDCGADEKIRQLDQRYAKLQGEHEELESLQADKQAALKELDSLKEEKNLLVSLIQSKRSEAESQDTGVVFPSVPLQDEKADSEDAPKQEEVATSDLAEEEPDPDEDDEEIIDDQDEDLPEDEDLTDDLLDESDEPDTPDDSDVPEDDVYGDDDESGEPDKPDDGEDQGIDQKPKTTAPADLDKQPEFVPYGESEEIKFD